MSYKHIRCPVCQSGMIRKEKHLECENSHTYDFLLTNQIPIFYQASDDSNEYTIAQAVEFHENALTWVFKTFDTTEDSLREFLLSKLGLVEGQHVLVTGAGSGNDLPELARLLGPQGKITALDISGQMLEVAHQRINEKYQLGNYNIDLLVADAVELPFYDKQFDAAYHFGGINLYDDIGKGLSEMNRVVKEGGRVVVSDEGVAPWMKESQLGKMLINNNPLYRYSPPMTLLPYTVKNVVLEWVLEGCFYVIGFTASQTEPNVILDIPHVGKRGGSILSRYFGQLEGIAPELKDEIYLKAEQKGLSRVEYLEALIKSGLERG